MKGLETHLNNQKNSGANQAKQLETKIAEINKEHNAKLKMKTEEIKDLRVEVVKLEQMAEKANEDMEKQLTEQQSLKKRIKFLSE